MPSYTLTQPFFSLTTSMTVKDEGGTERFRVEGAWLKIGVTLTDLATGDAVELRPEVLSMTARWNVVRSGQTVATFEAAGFFRQTYVLDVPGPNDLTIEQRSLMGLDAVFTRPDAGQVAVARSNGWGSGLTIEVAPGQDELLIVACAAILQLMRQQG